MQIDVQTNELLVFYNAQQNAIRVECLKSKKAQEFSLEENIDSHKDGFDVKFDKKTRVLEARSAYSGMKKRLTVPE